VEYRVSGALVWLPFDDGVSTATSVTVTGLLPAVTYEFRLGATNSVGTTYSDTLTVRTLGFTFLSFTPSSVSKGAAVDVVGSSLSLVTEVRIGTLVVPFRFVSDEILVVTVPSAAKTGVLRLISSSQNVSAGTLTVASRGTATPSITVVEPYVASPGAVLRVQGSNIGAASVVRVAGLDAVFSVTGRNALSLTLPLNANNGKVTITTPGGTATSSGTVVVPPRVTGSLSGGAGVLVSLAGENLADVTSVSLNGVSITPSAKALTSVSFVVPSNAVSGSGFVTGPGGVSSTFTFTLLPPPVLNAFSVSVKVGDTVTLSGSNLQGVTNVLIGTLAATSLSSTSTTVTFVVPTGAKTGTVTFTGAAGTVVSSSTLTVLPPPVITGMTPTSGKTGTTVTITGTGLTGATVTVGTKTATKSTNTATQIKFKIPTGLAKGTYTVKVVTANGETTRTFRVT
jgi:hypothetical protein